MQNYTSISIIYNPNSTGASKKLAEALQRRLSHTRYAKTIELIPTTYAGHAEELAYQLANASSRPLIISSSGDGGYHEVINGAMTAIVQGAKPVTGLLPAGNANDHYRNLHQKPVDQMIISGERHQIDLLKITVKNPSDSWQRYAHSYAGVGLTPHVGHALNQANLNRVNEKLITLKALWRFQPVQLAVAGETRSYDSLIASNVPHMSKVLGLSKEAAMDDGRFEITSFPHQTKSQLIKKLFKAATTGLEGKQHTASFNFRTPASILIQLDGEVKTILAGSRVEISLAPRALECVT